MELDMYVKYSTIILLLSVTCSGGAAVFAAFNSFRNSHRSLILPFTAFIFSVFGFVSIICTIGQPRRLFNALSHLSTGFSAVTLGLLLLAVLSALTLLSVLRGRTSKIAVIGFVAAIYAYYGIIQLVVLPSRAALYSWYAPMFIITSSVAFGAYLSDLPKRFSLFRIIFAVLRFLAIVLFLFHLSKIGVSDKHLSMELIKSRLPLLLFVSFAAVGCPIFFELYYKFKITRTTALLSGFFIFLSCVGFYTVFSVAVL
jgi:hypothetical protein